MVYVAVNWFLVVIFILLFLVVTLLITVWRISRGLRMIRHEFETSEPSVHEVRSERVIEEEETVPERREEVKRTEDTLIRDLEEQYRKGIISRETYEELRKRLER